MSEWMDMSRWPDCRKLERPGIVFELRNAAGQTLWTPCTASPPPLPVGWTSPPIRFRAVAERKPTHSAPLPPPARPRG
jgi:hypothetical protein